jgi:hypothetical protein
MLYPLDLHEYFIDEKGVAVSLVLPSQPLSKFRSEFIAPEAYCFIANFNTALGQQILDIAMT